MNTSPYAINIGDIVIEVHKKNIKNLHLSVLPPNGRVRISAPARLSDESIRLFGASRLAWIRKQQKKFLGQEREAPREYVSGESHYLFGKRYLLRVEESNKPAKVEIKGQKHLYIYVRPNCSLATRERVMLRWYREQLRQVLTGLIPLWEKKIGVKISESGIKRMKTRWGTCNRSAKRIWLTSIWRKNQFRVSNMSSYMRWFIFWRGITPMYFTHTWIGSCQNGQFIKPRLMDIKYSPFNVYQFN